MKRRTLTMVVGLLLCLSLIGVGFASWVISAGDEEVATGNIEVEAVTDKRLTMTVVTNNQSIHFGKPATMSVTNPWLTNPDGETEQLSATFRVSVAYKNGSTIDASELQFDAQYDATSDVKAAIEAQYIGAPTVTFSEVVNDNTEGNAADTTKVTYDVTIAFTWGEAFGNKNPYNYYNVEGKSAEDDGDSAYNALNAFYQMNAQTFLINLSVNLKTE